MLRGYIVITTGWLQDGPVADRFKKGEEMKELKTMAPVALLMVLLIAAMGVMVFWGLSLLDLSE